MRKGLAMQLLSYGIEGADEDGIPCYLEATTTHLPAYERLGSSFVDQTVAPTSMEVVVAPFMYRDAGETKLGRYIDF